MRKRTVNVQSKLAVKTKLKVNTAQTTTTRVYEDKHTPDTTQIKRLFTEAKKSHYNKLLTMAVDYMAVLSAIDAVVRDINSEITSEFTHADSLKDVIDAAYDRAMSFYLYRHALTLGDADIDSIRTIVQIALQGKPTGPYTTSLQDLAKVLGVAIRQGKIQGVSDQSGD